MIEHRESLVQYQQAVELQGNESLGGLRPKNINQMADSRLAIDCK